MFETATNAASTPIVPQDRFVVECLNVEEAAPYAPPGEQPKMGARPGIRWILALYSPTSGERFYFQDDPYEFFQTTTANMQRGARAREYAEAFLGREIREGEKLSPDAVIGKKLVGMVIHELSKDKTKKNAKLVAVEPVKTVAQASPSQVSADPTEADVDRALLISKFEKKVAKAVKKKAPHAAEFQAGLAAIADVSIEQIREMLDSIDEELDALDD